MTTDLHRRDLLRTAIGATATLPATLTARDTIRPLREEGLAARLFGVAFDGRRDDAAPLQRAVDEAARQRRPLILPSGIARLNAPIDLRDRHISIIGDPTGHTVLRAGAPLACLIDVEELREVIDSPLHLYGLTLDGAGQVQTGLRMRYRHRTVLDTIAVTACAIGIDEGDTWLGRRVNCRTRTTGVGWRLRGSNHSSVWTACSFIDAREVHLDIATAGAANDGNNALLFQACDVEFGPGDGIHVGGGASATFDTCYLGEGIGGDVLRNAGTVSIRGGALYVGHSARHLGIAAAGGRTMVGETSIHGQQFGSLDRLIGAVPAGSGSSGAATFRDVDMQLKLGGNPTFAGDVLGTLPMRVFASTLGRNWQATSSDARRDEAVEGDTRAVRCTAVTGARPFIGLAAQLSGREEARRDGPAYFVIVYSASKPVDLKFTGGPMSRDPWRLIGTLPASAGAATYVKADVPMDFTGHSTVELIMPAGSGDQLTLHHATVSDSSVLRPGLMANLAKAQ